MASDPSHKPGRCSPKCPEWAGCAVGCKPSNNELTGQISFQLSSRRGPYRFWRLQWSSPCTRACPRFPQNEVLDSHSPHLAHITGFSMWLSKTSFWGHLGHALVQGELCGSLKKLYGPFLLNNWKHICLASLLFEGLQPKAQPAHSGHFGEHLPGL